MKILGIDPGYAIIGYGIVDYRASGFHTLDYGSVTTPANIPVENRLEMIYSSMCELIDRFKPDDMAVEQLFFNTNQTTAIKVAEARGVILLAARQKGVAIYEYTPLQVKQAVVGYGKAEKKQVQLMVTTLLSVKQVPRPDDTADALAIAVCHAHSGGSGLSKILREQDLK